MDIVTNINLNEIRDLLVSSHCSLFHCDMKRGWKEIEMQNPEKPKSRKTAFFQG
jgi:hypothetical protein